MSIRLKPLSQQVIVITGASSGIGLATARMAAHRGAKLVVASRSEGVLRELVEELAQTGRQAAWVTADVAHLDEVRRIAQTAIERFGGFDTWINNAGVSAFGKLTDMPVEDHRRLFDINYFGVVNGSLVALEHLRERGGALINIGSIVSDATLPLQGAYSASKSAVEGFTNALRMELERDGAPVAVTLIKPTSIATPFTEHAMNYMDVEATLPPPVYAPEVAAEAILHCACEPTRELVVGGGGKFISVLGRYFPRLAEWYLRTVAYEQQRSDRPRSAERRGLYRGASQMRERGVPDRWAKPVSGYTKAAEHPLVALGVVLALGGALAALMGVSQTRSRRSVGTLARGRQAARRAARAVGSRLGR